MGMTAVIVIDKGEQPRLEIRHRSEIAPFQKPPCQDAILQSRRSACNLLMWPSAVNANGERLVQRPPFDPVARFLKVTAVET
jgi:hypothetical protein